ncbi:hypothetical protein LMH87_002633 [Akanthomyces muscarius]|uniref:Enoyl reductase (ER) domain-containing protein n=1 Tax=Akanthomyces muscarius TaxID=2231603 RepID=A0A9W8Q982_AKAMU|nr:hypothetical protein LMH87_002633 [Akanthomyces muscarius]KAJ4148151.1 hypothetical protein LMH87_002633 [Akanthomyces muscarius]
MSQKALLVTGIGDPLVLGDRPIPVPAPYELLVEVTSAGLNPHDQKARDKEHLFTGQPLVLAHDVVGKIIQTGSCQATTFTTGDHVFGMSTFNPNLVNDSGGLQQYAVLDGRYVAKVTDAGLTDDEAATIPVNSVVAAVAVFDASGLGIPAPFSAAAGSFDYASQSLVVIGGASNCGRFVIQLAKFVGIGRIVAVAAASNTNELKSLGASHVVDRHASDVVQRVRKIVGDDLVYAVDTVNYGPHQALGVAVLSNTKKGVLAVLLPTNGDLDEHVKSSKKMGFERHFVYGGSNNYPDLMKQYWKHLPVWIRNGHVKPASSSVIYGLDPNQVNECLDKYRDGTATVRVVVRPNV